VEYINKVLDSLPDIPYLWVGVAVSLLLFILWLLTRRQPRSFTAFKSTSGKIMITRSAISELAQRICDQTETVGKCSTRIKTRGGSLKIEVRIQMMAGSKLGDVTSDLQERLNHALGEILGIENLGEINVIVTSFIGNHESSSPPPVTESIENEYSDLGTKSDD
jgi:hypothetical protein